MSEWTASELEGVDRAEELQLASVRADGSPRPYVTIWAVSAGDQLYVRSAYGPDNPWYRRAKAAGGDASGLAASSATWSLRKRRPRRTAPSMPPITPSTTGTARGWWGRLSDPTSSP